MTFIVAFPLQARFENTIGKTLQNAFLIAISHLPFTVAIIILLGMVGYLCYLSWLVLLLMLLFGTGVIGYLLVYNFERLFKKCGYIDEDDGKIKNDDYEFEVEVDYDKLYNREDDESIVNKEAENEETNKKEKVKISDLEIATTMVAMTLGHEVTDRNFRNFCGDCKQKVFTLEGIRQIGEENFQKVWNIIDSQIRNLKWKVEKL